MLLYSNWNLNFWNNSNSLQKLNETVPYNLNGLHKNEPIFCMYETVN